MDKKVRYGLIGLGKIGTQHTKKLVAGAVPNLEYVAVADTDPKALAKAKELIGDQVLTFSSAEELIHSGTVDAIHICVTSPLDVITMKIQQVTGQAPGRSSAPAPSWRAPGWCAMWRISWRSPTGPSTCPWWGSMAPAPWP